MPNKKIDKGAIAKPSKKMKSTKNDVKAGVYKTPTGNPVRIVKEETKEKEEETRDSYQLVKPDDQLILTEAELNEVHARILTAANNLIPQNIVRFSYKEKKFKPVANIDQTYIHLQIIGHLIPKDTEEAKAYEKHQKIIEANKKNTYSKDLIDEYVDSTGKLCYRILKNKFNFIDRATQTFNNTSKDAVMQTEPPRKVNFSDNVNQYVLYKAYTTDFQNMLIAKDKKLNRLLQDRVLTAQAARKKRAPPVPEQQEKKTNEANRMLVSVKLVERMLCQNFYDDIIQDFKYFDDESDAFKREGTLLPLWKFPNSLVNNMSITCICWNPTYSDLFAASTGSWDFFNREQGIIVLFSLKNPSFYESLIETESGCMCLHFHPDYPWLLAAGFCDGTVCVYNLKQRFTRNDNFILKSIDGRKHNDPVWQVKWLKDDDDSNLNFCSIASDGRIKQWTIRKIALAHVDIVIMARDEDIQKYQNPDDIGMNDLFACGTCFDFNDKQEEIFIVGTEEGYVYEYSKFYKNTILTTFEAHSMPVYAIKWNYYFKRIFITCSSDWTVKIWHHDYKDPVFSFDLSEIVSDVAWAPYSSTVFAAVTTNGYVYIYDLSIDSFEPLCIQNVFNSHKRKRQITHLAFNPHHPILLIGDNKGTIYSFKISPNLRCEYKEERKSASISIVNKFGFELNKLKRIVEQELSYENDKVKTSRRFFDFEDRKKSKKEQQEKYEHDNEPKKRYQGK